MNQKQHLFRTLLLLLGLTFLFGTGAPIRAQQTSPTNVTLASFDLTPLNNSVRIEWTTDTEIDVLGFYVERGENGANFIRLLDLGQNGFISAQGSAIGGFDYEELDTTAENGMTYAYRLIEVETNLNELELATKFVSLVATATPAPIGGTFTAPTNTPLPSFDTPTPSRQATVTTSPTNTPLPSATPTPRSQGTTAANSTATSSPSPFPSATTQAETGATQTATSPESGARETPVPVSTPTTDVSILPATLPPPTPEVMPLPTFTTATPTPTPLQATPVGGNRVQAQEEDALAQAQPISGAPPTQAATAVSAAPDSQTEPDPGTARRGRLLLWAGFLVALIIFIISIVGSIFLFTRRQ